MDRDVLHINIGAFPIGVERVVNPRLRGRPVALAAPGSPRAVALEVSREAYLEGVRKGMTMAQAKKFCPLLTVIEPNEALYRRAAAAVHKLVSDYSPLIESWRMGHLHLDLTGTRRLFGPAVDTAARIQRELKARLYLRSSAGVAQNKLVSRVASRVIRPRGVCDVFPGGEQLFLAPLEVEALPGVGDKTADRLLELNIRLVGELQQIPPEHLALAVGALARRLHQAARGIDDSPVRPPERAPAVREEETLGDDTNDDRAVQGALFLLVERCCRRLRRLRLRARLVRIEFTYSDHVSARAEEKLAQPSDLDGPVFAAAWRLLEKTWTRRTRLRYLCLTLRDLAAGPAQLPLFGEDDVRERRLRTALDEVREKFGEKAVRVGRTVN
jgi:DNA polymerase-4